MKRILAALALALAAATSFGATLAPIQLLSPAGSASGQAIISTGPSTAATWGNVSAVALTGIVPVLNGGTGVTTAAAEVTRLSAAVTTGTLAQFSATSSAQLLGVLSDETGTGLAVFGTSPTITTPNIVGVTNGAVAAAGSVGEVPTAGVGTAVSLTTGTQANCTSKTLTAGMYLLYGSISFNPAGSTVMSAASAGISTTTGAVPAVPLYAGWGGTAPAGTTEIFAVPMQIVNVNASTTYFLVGVAIFTTSTATMTCQLNALRIR